MSHIHHTDKLVGNQIWMSLSSMYTHKKTAGEVALVVKKAVPVLRQLLQLPEFVDVRICPIKSKNTNGRYWNDRRLLEIDCRLPWNKALEVLCHEMVHCEQYFTGRLVDLGSIHKWHGQINTNRGSTYQAYRDQPWEQEAWSRQAELAEKVNQILEGK